MAKFVQIVFVALMAVALCSAEAPRSRTFRFQNRRNRFLARQEAAETAGVTPYPSADELKPEVPFDEAVAAEEQQPNQPDEIYGPPEEEAPIQTDDVNVPEEEQAEEEVAVAVAEDEQVVAEAEAAPARLTARRTVAARKSLVRPAKLRKAAPARLQLQPQFVPKPVFYYVAQ